MAWQDLTDRTTEARRGEAFPRLEPQEDRRRAPETGEEEEGLGKEQGAPPQGTGEKVP